MDIPLFFGHKFTLGWNFHWNFKWIRPKRDPLEIILKEVLANSKNVLVDTLRTRVLDAAKAAVLHGENLKPPEKDAFVLAMALNAAVYSRWDFKILERRWPEKDKATHKIISEALEKTDALLNRLVNTVQPLDSSHLREFVLPMGVPRLESADALGPIKDEVTIAADP